MIPFNKPFLTGNEVVYIQDAVKSGKISGNGIYTTKCHAFFQERYGFRKTLLTTSCTDALEMCAILADIQPGDEVIVPSYTFVSTANAFVLRGAKIIFADSNESNPNIDVTKLEGLITPKTKAIVVVHYAGIACDMDPVMDLADRYDLLVIEDAAQSIESFYKKRPLGGIGHLSAFSFHETKNIIAGEGGMLVINDERLFSRAEIIWEKGTNRSAFFRGDVDKYSWVDIGSSFLPSEVTAAFLYAQLENLEKIQAKRITIWNRYHDGLQVLNSPEHHYLPVLPSFATNNAHMFYLTCKDLEERDGLISHLRKRQVHPVFHYLSLHKSKFYASAYSGPDLVNSDRYEETIIRLPFYYELSTEDQERIIGYTLDFFK